MNEQLKIIISAEVEKLKKNVNDAKSKIKEFVKEGTKDFDKLNEEFQKVGDVSKKALVGVGAGIVAAGAALLTLGNSTKEYREEQAKLVTAFEAAGASAEEAKGTYNDLYRVLGDSGQATEAANHLAKLTTNQEHLSEWTTICQGVYATFGDSLPIEGLTEAANETAKVGTLTGGLADALNWAGVNEEEFQAKLDACTTEQEREALIRETLNGIYSNSAQLYEENAAGVLAQNEAQAKLDESMAKIGETMAPINAALGEFGAIIMETIAPIIQDFINEHGEKITKTLTDVAEAIGKVINWIADNWEIVSTIGAIVLGVATALSVFSTAMGIVNAVMAASPVTWIVLGIVAAVTALVAIIVLVIKHWDEIKAAGSKCWEFVKGVWDKAAGWFDEKIVKPIAKFFTGMWDGLKDGAKKAWEGIKSVFSVVTNWFTNVFKKAWEGVKAVFSTGGKIFTGIKDGIVSVFTTVVNAIIGGINKVIAIPFNAINKVLGKIRDIEILGVSPFSWISTFSVPEIPKLGKGGIVDSATMFIAGEAGKEAVLPLENNTEWITQIANKLSSRLSATTPVMLKVSEKVFGEIAVSSINGITRATGELPLVIA